MATDRKDRVNVGGRIPKDLSEKIDRLAENEDRDRSSMVRVLLREAVVAREMNVGENL